MRGVTSLTERQSVIPEISTHTPHAGRDAKMKMDVILMEISTHTPHAGRDSNIYGNRLHQPQHIDYLPVYYA